MKFGKFIKNLTITTAAATAGYYFYKNYIDDDQKEEIKKRIEVSQNNIEKSIEDFREMVKNYSNNNEIENFDEQFEDEEVFDEQLAVVEKETLDLDGDFSDITFEEIDSDDKVSFISNDNSINNVDNFSQDELGYENEKDEDNLNNDLNSEFLSNEEDNSDLEYDANQQSNQDELNELDSIIKEKDSSEENGTLFEESTEEIENELDEKLDQILNFDDFNSDDRDDEDIESDTINKKEEIFDLENVVDENLKDVVDEDLEDDVDILDFDINKDLDLRALDIDQMEVETNTDVENSINVDDVLETLDENEAIDVNVSETEDIVNSYLQDYLNTEEEISNKESTDDIDEVDDEFDIDEEDTEEKVITEVEEEDREFMDPEDIYAEMHKNDPVNKKEKIEFDFDYNLKNIDDSDIDEIENSNLSMDDYVKAVQEIYPNVSDGLIRSARSKKDNIDKNYHDCKSIMLFHSNKFLSFEAVSNFANRVEDIGYGANIDYGHKTVEVTRTIEYKNTAILADIYRVANEAGKFKGSYETFAIEQVN